MKISPNGFSRTVLRKVRHTIRNHNLFGADETVLVAVSGGADSVCLLHVLLTLAPAYRLRLGVAHLNHGLREAAAERDAAFVAALARRYDLPFFTATSDVKGLQQRRRLCLEEAGRKARYNFLRQTAHQHNFGKIATGHQQDDNVELALMFLIRGSGSRGVRGIPPVRENRIVRPLIDLKREEILGYLEANRLDFVADATNQDCVFLRNRIRLQLLPALAKGYNPRISDALARFVRVARAEDDWLESLTAPLLENACIARSDTTLTMSVDALGALHPAAQRRVLRRALEMVKGSLRRITFRHVEAALALINSSAPLGSLDLPEQIRIQRQRGLLIVTRENKPLREARPRALAASAQEFSYPVSAPGSQPLTIPLPEIRGRLKLRRTGIDNIPATCRAGQFVAFFDMDKLTFPLTVRSVRPGDRFTPLGTAGRQKVHRFFINQKIPRESRTRYPLLVSGGKIIWVAGLRVDEAARLTPATQRVLRGELLLA